MTDMIAFVILTAIIGLAGRYVYKAKKRGSGCIGCPMADECSGKCGCNPDE